MKKCLKCGALITKKACTQCGSSEFEEISNHCVNPDCKEFNRPAALMDKFCGECAQPMSEFKDK